MERLILRMPKYKLITLAHRLKSYLSYPNYLAAMLVYFIKWKEIVLLPKTIEIEPNNNCNFKCDHCLAANWNKRIVYLNTEHFNKILTQIPSIRSVKLQGLGEPMLNKQLIDMLKMGERRDISMYFFSNASLCDQSMAEQLAKLRNTLIIFSVDGATAETFEKIRKGGKFEEIRANIESLVKMRGSKKQPGIGIWALLTKYNIEEIPQMVELAKKLGVDFITLQVSLTNFGSKEMAKYTDAIRVNPTSKQLLDKLKEAKEVASKNKINMCVNNDNLYSKNKKCQWPWQSAFIAVTGDVVPCCILSNSDAKNMGNIFKKDFVKIWYSKEYRDLRQRIKNHDLPDWCKYCYVERDRNDEWHVNQDRSG